MDLVALLIALIALVGGFAVAWVLRSRDVRSLEVERGALGTRLDASEDMRNAALRDLAVEKARADTATGWREQAERMTAERDLARGEALTLKVDHQARLESYEAQIKALHAAREQLTAQFSEIGAKLLHSAQQQFLERADQRLHQAQERSEAQIRTLLTPVETTLKRYEEGLGRVEKDRVDSYAALREAVDQMRVGSNEARAETARLVGVLRNNSKARGRWGEQQLRNVLEMAGLSRHADYKAEVSVDTEDGRLRPDVIVRLPGGKQLVIDAKCSLNAYIEAVETEDEVARAAHMKAHVGAIRTHAMQLGSKDYWTRFDGAADYVVMFIPGEHFLSAALEQDGELWEWAFQKKVLLATPTNLVAIARTVAAVWRQEEMAAQAQQIGILGKEMYERIAVVAGHLRKMGDSLNGSVGHYNKLIGSFETRVLSTGRKFQALNVDTAGKEIDMVEAVDLMARLPAAPATALEPTGRDVAE